MPRPLGSGVVTIPAKLRTVRRVADILHVSELTKVVALTAGKSEETPTPQTQVDPASRDTEIKTTTQIQTSSETQVEAPTEIPP